MKYEDLERLVSQPRLDRFLIASENSKTRAKKLYAMNLRIAQTFYPVQMKKLTYIVVSIFLLASISCDKNFDNINQNPFEPTETSMGALFNTVIASLRMSNEEQLYINNETLYPITQQAALTRSSFPAFSVGTEVVWRNYYQALAHIRAIEDRIAEMEIITEPEALNNIKGMLKIITAYKTFRMTDLFGDIPFFDAGRAYQGLEFSRPAFDAQEAIYKFLLDELQWAADNMVASGNPTTEAGTPYVSLNNFDTLFGGEVFLWVKFANSLRLKHALRMAEKDPDFAEPILQKIINNNLPLIQDFEDVVMHPALQGWSRTSTHFGYFNNTGPFNSGLRLGSTMWNELADGEGLSAIIDPRTFIFFEPNNVGKWAIYPQVPKADTPESGGGPYAIVRDANHSFKGQANIYAPVNYYLVRDDQDIPEILMTAAEVYFCLAEVHQRGLGVSADAATSSGFYNLGVVASINFWQTIRNNSTMWESRGQAPPDLTQGDMFALTNHPKFNITEANDPLQKIYIQRWIDAFTQPWEAYSLLRRTGNTPMEKGGIEHYRFPYPPSEGIDNTENYEAQVANMGEDTKKVKVWWMN